MTSSDSDLFDPATRDRVRADTATGVGTVLLAATLVGGLMAGVLHHEAPVLARAAGACPADSFNYECPRALFNVIAGVIGLLLLGGLSAFVYRYRRIAPTVRCLSCGGRGWVMDLEPREGRCPRCAGYRFAYYTRIGRGNGLGPEFLVIDEPDQDGTALVERFRRTRTSLFDRYY